MLLLREKLLFLSSTFTSNNQVKGFSKVSIEMPSRAEVCASILGMDIIYYYGFNPAIIG